ncbi:IS1182 family transposase [Mammaliicoccus sciuri]|uniref:IS1182 family transposase n=1 Tax=Mammaliicoccus sciuri TaxID=1296 RepID=UPI003364CE54
MYKDYNMSQITLPLNIEVLIPENDIAHYVNQIVESIPNEEFYEFKPSRGASSYHPKLMLKIILYSYTQSIFSGRRIESFLKDSIRMMWLAQNQTPSYRTINRFRINPIMDKLLQSLFINFRTQLVELNLIDEDSIYIDGTKIEASANKYTFVWRKNTERYNSKVIEQSKEIYRNAIINEVIPELNEEQNDEISIDTLKDLEDALEQKIEDLNDEISNTEAVKERKVLRTKRSELNKTKKSLSDNIDRQVKYKKQLEILGERNSYSKTDHDATFMRMKDDHMMNGQLKPGYNLQIATNSQFVLSYDIFPNPTDTRTLIPFLNNIKNNYFNLPEYIVADAGYGSEENYKNIIDSFNRTPLITYSMYLKEQTKKYKENEFNTQNWTYDEIRDEFICPDNRRLPFKRYAYRIDKYNYQRDFKLYECENCSNCALFNLCRNNAYQSTNKKIMKNNVWEYFKYMTQNLLSNPETEKIYKQRKIDVEPVFGYLKAILGFTRMSLRGKSKVKRELGIALMATNIRKMVALRATKNTLKMKYSGNSIFLMNFHCIFTF